MNLAFLFLIATAAYADEGPLGTLSSEYKESSGAFTVRQPLSPRAMTKSMLPTKARTAWRPMDNSRPPIRRLSFSDESSGTVGISI